MDRNKQITRLSTMQTTQTFCKLQTRIIPIPLLPEYLTTNSHRNHEIALIFSMRSGNPQLNENLYIRHQREDDALRHWGGVESTLHFLEECPSYANARQRIKTFLDNKGLVRFSLLDVCLYEETFCRQLRWMTKDRRKRIDNAIKTYVEQIMTQRANLTP